jgi:hypothetical protein
VTKDLFLALLSWTLVTMADDDFFGKNGESATWFRPRRGVLQKTTVTIRAQNKSRQLLRDRAKH